jgi:nitrogen regulatory protein P-II 1
MACMAESKPNHKLLLIILDRAEVLDDLLTGFLDIGVPGATVLESRGMGSIIRKDMPIFAGLASLFPDTTGSRVIVSVMPEPLVDQVFELVEEVVGQINQPNSAVCVTLPVDQFRGIRHTGKKED